MLQSGEVITVETATHHAGDDYNKVSACPEPVNDMPVSGLWGMLSQMLRLYARGISLDRPRPFKTYCAAWLPVISS